MATPRPGLERPAFYALRAGARARPRHAAAPAVHGVAPELRAARRRGRAGRPRRAPRGDAGRVLPRGRRRARTRWTSCTAGRWRRALSRRTLVVLAVAALVGAVAIGVVVMVDVSWTLAPFVVVGTFLVLAYNLEWFGGRFHTDLWFALAWGAFPALTSWWIQALAVPRVGAAGGGRLLRAERRPAAAEHAGARVASSHRVAERRTGGERRNARGASPRRRSRRRSRAHSRRCRSRWCSCRSASSPCGCERPACSTSSCPNPPSGSPTAARRNMRRPTSCGERRGRLRLDQTRVLGQLVRWRIPGLPADLRYLELLRSEPFVVLHEAQHELVCGLCGRIWTLRRDYPVLDGADAFRAFHQPGTVRVLYANWVADADGRGRNQRRSPRPAGRCTRPSRPDSRPSADQRVPGPDLQRGPRNDDPPRRAQRIVTRSPDIAAQYGCELAGRDPARRSLPPRQQIGAGGMSTVYVAFDTTLERHVAIKVMHRDIAARRGAARALPPRGARDRPALHPYVVGVIDAGEEGEEADDVRTPYIVLEYVEGETLKERIRRCKRLDVDEAVAYAIEIARALEAAHDREIVHRDVKPQNVLIDEEGDGQGHRLRHRSLARPGGPDRRRPRARHDRLRLARAGARPRRHRPVRPLLARHRAVRDADRRRPVPRREPGQPSRCATSATSCPDVQLAPPGGLQRAGGGRRPRDRQGPRRALRRRRRDDRRPRGRAGDRDGAHRAHAGRGDGGPAHAARASSAGGCRCACAIPRRSRRARAARGRRGDRRDRPRDRRQRGAPTRADRAPRRRAVADKQPALQAVRARRGRGATTTTRSATTASTPRRPRALDRDPGTSWSTENYVDGSLGKAGVGLYVDAKPTVAAPARWTSCTPTPGWKGDVYGAPATTSRRRRCATRAGRRSPRSPTRRAKQASILDTAGNAFRYYLIWITSCRRAATASRSPRSTSTAERRRHVRSGTRARASWRSMPITHEPRTSVARTATRSPPTASRRRSSRVNPGIVLSSLSSTSSPSTKKSARARPLQPGGRERLDGELAHPLASPRPRSAPGRRAPCRPARTWPRSRTSPAPRRSDDLARRARLRLARVRRAPSTRPRSPARRPRRSPAGRGANASRAPARARTPAPRARSRPTTPAAPA